MTPVIIGNATLYLGDCLDVLPLLGRVEAIVTDPPYGIGFARGAGRTRQTKTSGSRGTRPIYGDSAPFDPSPLLAASENIIMFGADHMRASLPRFGRFLAWDKLGGQEPWDSFSDVEFAWHSRPGAARIFSQLWKGMAVNQAGESDGMVNGRMSRLHPMQKPVRLMRWCIEQAGTPGTVVDPYMGCGTTGVAAVELGLAFVGVEIDPEYFAVAIERIKNAQRQGGLFAEPVAEVCGSGSTG